MSDTPETDKAIKCQSEWRRPFISYTMDGITWDGPVADLCRRLERERDEATRSLEKEKIALNYFIKRGISERDEYRNEIEGWRNKWECAVDMAARAENERDEASRMIDKITEIGIDLMDKNRSLKREIKKLKKSSNHKL